MRGEDAFSVIEQAINLAQAEGLYQVVDSHNIYLALKTFAEYIVEKEEDLQLKAEEISDPKETAGVVAKKEKN